MNFWRILVLVFLLVYIFSPVDLLPDIFPITGWLDDAFLLGVVLYYLRKGRLPAFLSWLGGSSGSRRQARNKFDQQGADRETQNDPGTQDPHELLGLKPGAGPDEIHAAYRRAVQMYHPDKVSHLGAEFQELAARKFVAIQAAYEKLMGKDST